MWVCIAQTVPLCQYMSTPCVHLMGVTDHASMKYMQFCFAESPESFERDPGLRFGMKIEEKEEIPYALCTISAQKIFSASFLCSHVCFPCCSNLNMVYERLFETC